MANITLKAGQVIKTFIKSSISAAYNVDIRLDRRITIKSQGIELPGWMCNMYTSGIRGSNIQVAEKDIIIHLKNQPINK